MAQRQNQVAKLLFRIECPSPDELRDYQFQLLSPSRADEVALHLAICPHCTREVAMLGEFLAEPAPAPEESWLERVKTLVARLASSIPPGPQGLTPAFGLRGESEGPLLYLVDQIQVSLFVVADSARFKRKVLEGQILGVETAGWQAHLWSGETLAATAFVDDKLGDFVIIGLTPGSYRLILTGPEMMVQIPEVQVM
jgi:hypothetical protein